MRQRTILWLKAVTRTVLFLLYQKDMVNPLSYVFYYFQKQWYITIVLRDKIKNMKEGIDHEKDV